MINSPANSTFDVYKPSNPTSNKVTSREAQLRDGGGIVQNAQKAKDAGDATNTMVYNKSSVNPINGSEKGRFVNEKA